MFRFGFRDDRGATESHDVADRRARLAFVRREVPLTIAGLVTTLSAAALTTVDMLGVLAIRIEAQAWSAALAQSHPACR